MNWIYDFQLFLFDFDGLLVDTEALHHLAYVNVLAKRGYCLDWNFSEYSALAHLNATALREGIYARFPNLDPDWGRIYEEKKQEYLELISSGCLKLMPGVAPLLEALEKANIRRSVVTHAMRNQTLLIRSKLPLLNTIPHWVTREDYEKPKPDPECYLKAIELYGRSGDRIIGFEDSLRGLEALKGTPALPILVCPSHHPLLEISTEKTSFHYPTFDELLKQKTL